MLSGISCANLNQNNQSIPNILDRISAGDLSEKEISEIYTKNYKPELEYHEIFQKCISHLYTQKKKTNSSMLSKIFFGFEKIVSNPNKLQIPEMGLKVDCEVYLTKVLSIDYREKKTNEKNPLNEKIEELKTIIKNLNDRYDNLAIQSLLQRSENKIKKSGEKKDYKTTGGSSSTTKISGGSSTTVISGGSSSSSSTTNISGGSSSSTTVINGGSSSSTSTSTTTTTLDINSDVPTYITTDGEFDNNKFNSVVDSMKAQIKASNTKYSSLEIRYEKVLRDYSSLKTEFSSGKDNQCDCDKKLKACEYNLIEKENKITILENTIIDWKTKYTICETNPPKKDCSALKDELNKQVLLNQECQKQKVEITNKWTTIKVEIENYKTNYGNLKIKYDLLIKDLESCKHNITIIEKKITTINRTCEEKTLNLTLEITKLTLEINNCKKGFDKCKRECKKPDPQPDGNDILIKHQYEECLIKVSSLHTQINIKNTKIENLTIELSNRDKNIIDLRSRITTLELHLKNCKSENEKIIDDLNIKIRYLEINIKTCESEKETLIIYKTKYEKCDSNCNVNITKLNLTISTQIIKISSLTEKLKKCNENNNQLNITIEKQIKIINKLKLDIKNCSEKEKNCSIKLNIKITEITTIIEENKTTIINIQNTFNKKCEEEKKALTIKINLIQIQLDTCNKKKDLGIDYIKCQDKIKELNILIINYKKTIEEFTTKIETCTKDLSITKTTIIEINNKINNYYIIQINNCKKDLDKCKEKDPRQCDDSKYNDLLIKFNKVTLTYETVNESWITCKSENTRLLILIDEYKKRKCDETCDGKLQSCENNITTITNNYESKIEIKVTLINQLNIRIEQLEKDCKNDYINIQLKLKTCESSKFDIKNKYDLCEFDLKNEINLRITYYKELTFIKKEYKNCTKQAICKEDEINMFKRVAERCEESKITITKHLDSLKEKFGKLHKDKVNFFHDSNSLLSNLSKKCQIDSTTLTKFMATFNINVQELNSFREGIIADIKKDEIDKNKDLGIIQLKREEINRTQVSIKQINSEITVIVKSSKELIQKLNTSTNLEAVKTLIAQLKENETNLRNKNSLLITYIERLNRAEMELKVLDGDIKNAERIKVFRNSKYTEVHNISTNVEKSQVEIKKFINSKITASQTIEKKVQKYKKNDIAQNPLVAILRGEKDIINNKINNYRENNMKLEKQILELNKKLTIMGDKSNKESIVSESFKDGTVMKLFQNTDLVLNNCKSIKEFSAKVNEICKKQENGLLNKNEISKSTTNTSIITTSKISKRKTIKNNSLTPDIKPSPVVVTPVNNTTIDKEKKEKEIIGKNKNKNKNSPMDDFIKGVGKKTDVDLVKPNLINTITPVKPNVVNPVTVDANKPLDIESQEVVA